jgi:circadian clock protein KaiB
MMTQHFFKLYVMGNSSRSNNAIDNLKGLCEEFMPSNYELAIIDVLENPSAAEIDKIFATPTLIKNEPPPVRRIIGDLGDRDQVIRMLDIDRPTVKRQ